MHPGSAAALANGPAPCLDAAAAWDAEAAGPYAVEEPQQPPGLLLAMAPGLVTG
jgi:hypothetical protein